MPYTLARGALPGRARAVFPVAPSTRGALVAAALLLPLLLLPAVDAVVARAAETGAVAGRAAVLLRRILGTLGLLPAADRFEY